MKKTTVSLWVICASSKLMLTACEFEKPKFPRSDNSALTATLNDLIKAGSNDMKASYEGVLDAIRQLVSATRITDTQVGDAAANEPMYAVAA